MASVTPTASCSISGRHTARRKTPDRDDPNLIRARCSVCGYALVRTLATRRWMISAYLG